MHIPGKSQEKNYNERNPNPLIVKLISDRKAVTQNNLNILFKLFCKADYIFSSA